MAINLTDFDKIWASSSPLTPYSFSDANYEEGWNFVGATPPARQMWDSYMKFSDEKQQYIVNNFLPLSGGAMTGTIILDTTGLASRSVNDNFLQINGGTEQTNGAWLRLNGKDNTGVFQLCANDGANDIGLVGNPDGTLKWNSKEVERVHAYSISASTGYIRYVSGLQIVWGSIDVGTTAVTETYAVAFSAYPSVTATPNNSATIYIPSNNETRFTVRTASGTTTVRYIAIGKWQ